jgi:hypothetical protein
LNTTPASLTCSNSWATPARTRSAAMPQPTTVSRRRAGMRRFRKQTSCLLPIHKDSGTPARSIHFWPAAKECGTLTTLAEHTQRRRGLRHESGAHRQWYGR